MKTIVMKRLFIVVTKRSFFTVTKLNAYCSNETTFSSLKDTRFLRLAYWSKETKCSYYFFVSKGGIFSFQKCINVKLYNDSISCFRNANFWVSETPFFGFQKRHFLGFRNAIFWVSETPFFEFQKRHFWISETLSFSFQKRLFFGFRENYFLSFRNTIFFCLWNAKKDWLEVFIFSSPSLPPPASNPSLKAQIPSWRPKSHSWVSYPLLEDQIPALRLKSELGGQNPILAA